MAEGAHGTRGAPLGSPRPMDSGGFTSGAYAHEPLAEVHGEEHDAAGRGDDRSAAAAIRKTRPGLLRGQIESRVSKPPKPLAEEVANFVTSLDQVL